MNKHYIYLNRVAQNPPKNINVGLLIKKAKLEEKKEKRHIFLYTAAAVSALTISGIIISQ